MNEILTAVSTVGFPVVACGALGWYVYKLTQTHRAEVEKLADVIANNTRAIERLTREVKRE